MTKKDLVVVLSQREFELKLLDIINTTKTNMNIGMDNYNDSIRFKEKYFKEKKNHQIKHCYQQGKRIYYTVYG